MSSTERLLLRALRTLEARLEETNKLLREQRDDYQELLEALTQDEDESDTG